MLHIQRPDIPYIRQSIYTLRCGTRSHIQHSYVMSVGQVNMEISYRGVVLRRTSDITYSIYGLRYVQSRVIYV